MKVRQCYAQPQADTERSIDAAESILGTIFVAAIGILGLAVIIAQGILMKVPA